MSARLGLLKLAVVLGGLLGLASSWTAMAGPAASSAAPHVLRFAFPIAETGFDPAQISDLYSGTIASNIFEPPLTYDYLARPIQLKPLTAAALPEVSADFREFTVRLKPGSYFADDAAFNGRPRELVAADYVYSLKRNFDPRLKSPNYASLQSEKILGMEALRSAAVKSGRPFDYDTPVAGLQVLDRYTFRIRLGRSSPRFTHKLTQGFIFAVAREVVERYGDTFMEHPVGTGAFRLSEWRRSSKMVLLRNPNFRESYYDEQPAADDTAGQAIALQMKGRRLPLLDRVEVSIITEGQPRWLAFLAGDFDTVAVPSDFLDLAAPGGQLAPNLAKRGLLMHKALSSDVSFTYFNMEDPLVGGYSADRVALRRAIALGYDNEQEIRQLHKRLAIPAQSILVPNTYGYLPDFKSEMSEYNPARARALLDLFGYVDRDGDGWREQPDGSPLVLEFHTQTGGFARQSNELWLKHMKAIGLRLDFKFATWPDQMKMARAGNLMIWQLSWGAGSPDSEDLLNLAYGPAKGETNLVRFDLPAYDRLIEQTLVLPDGPERQALITAALRLLTAYMPMKAHAHSIGLRLSQPWVTGYQPNPFSYDFWRLIDSQPPAP